MRTKFLRNYVFKPNQVGAVTPSSRYLCRMIVDGFDWKTAKYAVEYGPGTGAATPMIMEAVQPGAKFFAVERNPEFCQLLREKFPSLDWQKIPPSTLWSCASNVRFLIGCCR